MTKTTRIADRVATYRVRGMSFRAIEAKLTRTLGLKKPGNGTKAYRVWAAI